MRQIGRFEIVREIGKGGMGRVFEAKDPLIRRSLAIKTIQMETLGGPEWDTSVQVKVLREAHAAGALSHPGIVVIHDVGHQEGLAYIAMELVEGPTVRQVLADCRRMVPSQALDVLHQAAEALDYAHERGVVHRDVKPSNIMLHHGSMVKITDFGLAKVVSTQSQTHSGALQGTPDYMSPEQIQSQPVDGRSDQFSLAVTAFEMLVGKRPFVGESLGAVMHNILNQAPPSASQLVPDLPTGVDIVLRTALAKSPEKRYRTCLQFVDALKPVLIDLDDDVSTMLMAPPAVMQPDSSPTRMAFAPLSGWLLRRRIRFRKASSAHTKSTPHKRKLARSFEHPEGRSVERYRGLRLVGLVSGLTVVLSSGLYVITPSAPLTASETAIVWLVLLSIVLVLRWVYYRFKH